MNMEKNFIEWVNKEYNKNYKDLNDFCDCEWFDDYDMYYEEFCNEKGYDINYFWKELQK